MPGDSTPRRDQFWPKTCLFRKNFSRKERKVAKRPTVLKVLVKKFGLTPISTPDADIKALAG